MSNEEKPQDGEGPKDPFTIADELQAYLGAIADDETEYKESLTEEDLAEEDLAEEEELELTSVRVVASLAEEGIELGLEDGKSLRSATEWPADDRMFDLWHVAHLISTGLVESGMGDNYDSLAEAIARLSVSTYLSEDDKCRFLDVIEKLTGKDNFQRILKHMDDNRILENARNYEVTSLKLSKEREVRTLAISYILIQLGVSPQHDDFKPFCEYYDRIVSLQEVHAPSELIDPQIQKMRQSGERLGIDREVLDNFDFGIEY